MPWYYVVLIVAATFLVPMVLGHFISRAVRLPEQSWRISLVLFSLLASAVVTYSGWPPKLGIDLSGGSILVYEVKDFSTKVDMEKLIAAVTLRINPGGVKEVTIRPYGVGQIEIIIPKATPEELEQIKDKISATGLLEFRILANSHDHSDLIARAQQLDNNIDQLYGEGEGDSRELLAQWFPVLPAEVAKLGPDAVLRENDKQEIEALAVMDIWNVNGGYLERATPDVNERGEQCVDFTFNSRGADLFAKLTRANLPDPVQRWERQLAIILDGTIYSAPGIKDVISRQGQISGGSFTPEQTTFLSEVLTAGSLPTALRKEPSTELVTGPTLGADTIIKGRNSMLVATVAVVIFMVIYYQFAGIVANLALLLNVLLIVACMILFNAAFTLTGLAGLALTVGMAVDANVLIYERMREELSRGATLRMAIRNGFGRATTTIVDANVTTLIAAIVLFAIGTDQVKGFAVTLILGIIMNLYTAIFCSRVLFDMAEKMRWITQMRMLHILSNPNFDFIGKKRLAIGASLVVIAIGLAGVVGRGRGLLDIDFTGGVSIEVLFDKPQEIAFVRDKLESVGEELPDVTVQDVQITDEEPGLRYVINTSRQDTEDVNATRFVENKLKELFPGMLAINRMTVQQVALVEAQTAEKPAGKAPDQGKAAPSTDEKKKAADGKGKSTDAKGTGSAAPSDRESLLALSRPGRELVDGLLALADSGPAAAAPLAMLLVQDEAKDATKQPQAESQAPKQDAKTSDTIKPDAAKAVEPAAPKSKADSTAAPKTKGSSAAKATDAAALAKTDRFVGGASATLSFSVGISQKHLEDMIRGEVIKSDPSKSDVSIELTSPEEGFEAGSEKDYRSWNLRIAVPPQQATAVLKEVNQRLAAEPTFPSSNKIGAAVAGNTQRQAAVALLASMALIVVYVWFRFKEIVFGLAGIIALVHDVLVTLGALALSYWLAPYLGFLLVEPFKISLPVVAAFLTIIGYSINDTIVIFDRIREVRGKSPYITAELANSCINQTLSRTILTSLTVFIVVLILYAVGGQGIHSFAFAMVVGIVSGTFSTVYIATPLVLWMNRSNEGPSKTAATGQRATQPAATG